MRAPERAGGIRAPLIAAGVVLVMAVMPAGAGIPDRHVSFYGAVFSPNRLVELVGIRWEPIRTDTAAGLMAVAVAWHLSDPGADLRLELEAQLAQHLGAQTHQELNGVVVARWQRFPWDHYVETSVAIGQGLSLASRIPDLEPRADPDEAESARLLNYLLVEIELGPPDGSWSGFLRLHHRSGVFGLYGNVRGGSNFVGLGARYRF